MEGSLSSCYGNQEAAVIEALAVTLCPVTPVGGTASTERAVGL